MRVKIKKLDPNAVIPSYSTDGSAGMDLVALYNVSLWPGARCLIHTGISVEIPPGYEGQVRSRSGLSLKHGIIVLNSPGTIDADYRGEVGVILHNASKDFYTVRSGDRIAQLVFSPIRRADIIAVEELADSDRGEDGFGSTGR